MAAANIKSVLASGMMSVAAETAANGQKLLHRLLNRRGLVGRPLLRVHEGLLGVRRRCVDRKLVRLFGSGALIDSA